MEDAVEDDQLALQSYPWLLIRHMERPLVRFFSISQNKYFKKTIPELVSKIIHGSCHGWLIVEDFITKYRDGRKHSNFLLDPITREKIQLPSFYRRLGFCMHCILSLPPTDPNCHVVYLDNENRSIVFCRLGDDYFKEEEFDADWGYLSSPVVFQGKMYCLQENHLMAINLVDSQIQVTAVMAYKWLLACPSFGMVGIDADIVECGGELLLVARMDHGLSGPELHGILIFRIDIEEKKLTRMEGIGESTIFLGRNNEGITCNAGEEGVSRNSVYFLGTRSRERHYYEFNLEDESLRMVLPWSAAGIFDELLWLDSPTSLK